jgi:group I intron endonuclease
VRSRCTGHLKVLKDGRHPNRHLRAAWKKYGERAFEFRLLSARATDECLRVEQGFIDEFHSYDRACGYNLSPTAGSSLGTKLSSETRRKISVSKKGVGLGKKMSDDARRKISRAMKGNRNGKGHTYRMSEAEKRRRLVDDTGKRYGRLTVIRYYDTKPHARWVCLCDCGKEIIAHGNNLRKGNTQSCGCLAAERTVESNRRRAGWKHTAAWKRALSRRMMGNKLARRKPVTA